MINVLVGGLLAIAGGVLASCVNATFQRWDIAAKEHAQRERTAIDNRNRAYYEFMSFLNQFLQFLHPSVGEKETGKYTAGLSFVEHIKVLSQISAGVQLYGSKGVGQMTQRFFNCYNEIPEKHSEIDKIKFDELNAIGAEVAGQMRAEIEADLIKNSDSNQSKNGPSKHASWVKKSLLAPFVKDWPNVIVAVGTVITCCIAGCELKTGGEAWRSVAEMFMSVQQPVFLIERVPYLATDGKNFDHEDCRISNIGDAPRCYLVREIKEYLVMNFSGSKVPHWGRKVVVPIQFYRYGVGYQGLKGIIYEKKGECARLKAFEYYNKARDFFNAYEIGYYDSVDVLAHVSYIDRFGKEIDCYYKCNSVGG